jgi:cation:H+ antiporter
MLVDILLLLFGLAILIFGANWLVEGSSSVAAKLGISSFTIGLTVVAFGTSMPELVVNILASFSESSGLAIGNVVGSNIINVFLVVGIAALVKPINIQSTTIKIEIPFSFLASVVLIFLANDILLDGADISILSRTDGLILLTFLVVFLYYTYLSAKSDVIPPVSVVKVRKNYQSILMVIVGIGGLYWGGDLIVDTSVRIAQSMGVSDAVIGLTVVAVGTSLPELVTSVVAAFKGNSEIAIGNVLGSNIFNIFMVLGVSSIIIPLPMYPSANIDLLVVCLASLLLFAFALIGPGQKIDRKEGGVFVVGYLIYLTYLIVNA